jgi:nicotinamide-nucleotide amidase
VSTSPAEVLAKARARSLTVGTAESLTGGLVAAALTSVPGASDVFVGGVVAYSRGAKEDLLGVAAATVAMYGPVSEETALAMADAARRLLGSDLAVATTGAAGPEPHGGRAPGTFCVAVVGPFGSLALTAVAPGGRDAVRGEAVNRAIQALCEVLDSATWAGTRVE